MLADSKLPHKFWGEVLSTQLYLRNRSPNKALTEITTYEAWYGFKPDLKYLVAVLMFMYPKLRGTSLICLMLGYSSTQKGYRLYDVEQMKVVHRRNVAFDETSTPGFQKETTTKYVELEVNGDEVRYTESHGDGELAEPDQVTTMPTSEDVGQLKTDKHQTDMGMLQQWFI